MITNHFSTINSRVSEEEKGIEWDFIVNIGNWKGANVSINTENSTSGLNLLSMFGYCNFSAMKVYVD